MHTILTTTTTKGDEEEEEEEEPSSYTDHEEEQEQPCLLHRTDDSSSACPRTKPDSPFSSLDLHHPPAQSSQHHLPSLAPSFQNSIALQKCSLSIISVFFFFFFFFFFLLLLFFFFFSSCSYSFFIPLLFSFSFTSSSKFAYFHQTKFIPPICPVSRIPQPYKKLLLLLLLLLLFPHMKFLSIKSQQQQREIFLPKILRGKLPVCHRHRQHQKAAFQQTLESQQRRRALFAK